MLLLAELFDFLGCGDWDHKIEHQCVVSQLANFFSCHLHNYSLCCCRRLANQRLLPWWLGARPFTAQTPLHCNKPQKACNLLAPWHRVRAPLIKFGSSGSEA